MSTKINKIEKYKKNIHPFDRNIVEKLKSWSECGDCTCIPEEDRDIGLKWYGIFYRKATPGYFMVRVRITSGKLLAQQAKVLAKLSKEFGKDEIDLTSREQIQLRWIKMEHLPEIISKLNSIGLTTLQTGMDNIRNITGDPLSGLASDSIIDTIPLAKQITDMIIGNKEFADFPRKLNIAILGSLTDSINCLFNDICLSLAEKEGVYGFNVYAGGKIGSGGPQTGFDLDLFTKPEGALDIVKAILEIYRDFGNREDRNKNRLYFLIKDTGVEKFRAEIENKISKNLSKKGKDLVINRGEREEGVIKQKNGLYAVGVFVPAGIFSGTDLERLAFLSQKYGNGEIRLTVYQNIYIVNVPAEKVKELLSDSIFEKYPLNQSPYLRGLMACQGSKTCSFGVIENKTDALKLSNHLAEYLPVDKSITMHWSGCVKGCGQHGGGDIGFMGTKIKVDGETKLAVDVFLKDKKIKTVPLDDLNEFVANLLKEKL